MQIVVSTPACVIVSDGILAACEKIVPKSTEWNVQNSSKMPMVNPKSPIRVVMNAFLPALIADCFRNQKPISK